MKAKNAPIIFAVVIVLILAVGLLLINTHHQEQRMTNVHTNSAIQESTNPTSNQPTVTNTNTNDQQLDKDTEDIQNSLNSLQDDQTKVDQSINQSTTDQSSY